MGRTKDQYIEYLNTLDQDDPQNREIQDRKPDNNKPKERDSNVINDKREQVGDGERGVPCKPERTEQD